MSDRLQTQDSDQDYSWDDWANEEPGRQALATELVDEMTEDTDLDSEIGPEPFASAPKASSPTESWAEPDSDSVEPVTDESPNEQQSPEVSESEVAAEDSGAIQALNTGESGSSATPASEPSRASLVVLYLCSLMVSAVVAGYAVLTILQGQWQQLWPLDSGLYQDLGIAVGGILVLGVLGSLLLGRSATLTRNRYQQAEQVVDRIAALDPANEASWCETWEQAPPGVETFLQAVSETMDRQRSKLDRYLGLEGELFRLEKTITSNLRDEVEGPYENPAVARLGEATAKLFDDVAAANQEQTARRDQFQETDAMVSEGLRQVHFWNQRATESISQQHQAMSHLIPELKRLRGEIQNEPQLTERLAHATRYAQEIGDQLAKLPAEFEGQTDRMRKLGDAWTELSGTAIAWNDPDVEPLTDLGIERFDPFVKEPADPEPVDDTTATAGFQPDHLDPFASGTSALATDTPAVDLVTRSTEPTFGATEPVSPTCATTIDPVSDPEMVSQEPLAAVAEPTLPETEEKIYALT